jgi:hypothetical protein
MRAADYHRAGAERMKADRLEAEQIAIELERKFERWAALEAKKGT